MVDNIVNTHAQVAKETALVLNIINQAWDDASRPVTPGRSASSGSAVTNRDRMEAIAFLTADKGKWAVSRATICEVAGINPEVLRQAAIAMIERGGHAQT